MEAGFHLGRVDHIPNKSLNPIDTPIGGLCGPSQHIAIRVGVEVIGFDAVSEAGFGEHGGQGVLGAACWLSRTPTGNRAITPVTPMSKTKMEINTSRMVTPRCRIDC